MEKQLLGEFMGTMLLILLGNGVVAGVLLNKSKAQDAGWIVITAGWALAVMVGVFTAVSFGSAGAHLNPAVTMGMAIKTGDFGSFLPYAAAQMLGAMAGATLVWLHYFPHWSQTPDADKKLACFCTAPAIRNPVFNLVSEIIGTFVLVLVGNAMFSKAATNGAPAPGVGPYLVGCLVWAIGMSLGGTTGYAINPARDLGPRIVHAVLPISKKGGSDWGYALVPIAGPLIGGALAGAVARAAGI